MPDFLAARGPTPPEWRPAPGSAGQRNSTGRYPPRPRLGAYPPRSEAVQQNRDKIRLDPPCPLAPNRPRSSPQMDIPKGKLPTPESRLLGSCSGGGSAPASARNSAIGISVDPPGAFAPA